MPCGLSVYAEADLIEEEMTIYTLIWNQILEALVCTDLANCNAYFAQRRARGHQQTPTGKQFRAARSQAQFGNMFSYLRQVSSA